MKSNYARSAHQAANTLDGYSAWLSPYIQESLAKHELKNYSRWVRSVFVDFLKRDLPDKAQEIEQLRLRHGVMQLFEQRLR